MNTEHELVTIANFIKNTVVEDSIGSMETNLSLTIGFSQRVGELLSDAEFNLAKKREQCLNDLLSNEDETETQRKAKLDSWVAEEKRTFQNLKMIFSNLKALRFVLMQAIKTRRDGK